MAFIPFMYCEILAAPSFLLPLILAHLHYLSSPTTREAVGWSFLRRPVMSLCRNSTLAGGENSIQRRFVNRIANPKKNPSAPNLG